MGWRSGENADLAPGLGSHHSRASRYCLASGRGRTGSVSSQRSGPNHGRASHEPFEGVFPNRPRDVPSDSLRPLAGPRWIGLTTKTGQREEATSSEGFGALLDSTKTDMSHVC